MRGALNGLWTVLALAHAGLAKLGTWWAKGHLWCARWWEGLRR